MSLRNSTQILVPVSADCVCSLVRQMELDLLFTLAESGFS